MVTAQTSGEAQSKSESVGITDTFHFFSSNVSVCPDTFGGVSPECVGFPDTLRFPLHICRLKKFYRGLKKLFARAAKSAQAAVATDQLDKIMECRLSASAQLVRILAE